MSMELDIKIGRLAYGWSEEPTDINQWYDPWAQLWRPVPDHKHTATPAFSTSVVNAIELVEYLAAKGINTIIAFDDSYCVGMSSRHKRAEYVANDLPTGVAKCFLQLKEEHEDLSERTISFKAQAVPSPAG